VKRPAPFPLRRYGVAIAESVACAIIELVLAAALAALLLASVAYLAVRWIVRGCAAWARALWSATVAVMGS
jgi:hypothetical protein